MNELPELTTEQLEKYPVELRNVVRRHGEEMFNFAVVVAGTNQAIDKLLKVGDRFMKLREPSVIILNNMSTLCEVILKLNGWDMGKVTECIQDIGRAQALTAGRPTQLLH